jgi:hypothetical protein
VRQGASGTAAYHLQLTVAAVARPVRGSVGAPGVLAAERSWLLLAQTASARRSVQPVFERSGVVAVVDAASRHATASAAGVSSMRCPPIRFRCPGSGCPAVRCPVTWGRRPEVRRSAVCCPPVRCPAVCCPPVRCPAVCCLPRRSGRVRLLPPQAVALGTQVEEAGTRATLPKSRWSVGGRWGRAAELRAGRGGRACPLSDQAGQAGVRSAHRGRLRGGHGSRLQREVAAPPPGCRPRLGARPRCVVVADPGARVGGPGGPLEVPAGMGVRPQRGPSRQRALPARCRQCSDLRRWVVGLPGLEPGTSSLSAKCREPLC